MKWVEKKKKKKSCGDVVARLNASSFVCLSAAGSRIRHLFSVCRFLMTRSRPLIEIRNARAAGISTREKERKKEEYNILYTITLFFTLLGGFVLCCERRVLFFNNYTAQHCGGQINTRKKRVFISPKKTGRVFHSVCFGDVFPAATSHRLGFVRVCIYLTRVVYSHNMAIIAHTAFAS